MKEKNDKIVEIEDEIYDLDEIFFRSKFKIFIICLLIVIFSVVVIGLFLYASHEFTEALIE